MENKKGIASLLSALIIIACLVAVALALWTKHLDSTIKDRLSQKRWAAPTEFYSAPERVIKGQKNITEVLSQTLERLEYKKIQIEKTLAEGEYSIIKADKCKPLVVDLPEDTTQCWTWLTHIRKDQINPAVNTHQRSLQIVAITQDTVLQVYEGPEPILGSPPLPPATVIELEPELFAQFYGGQPVLRRIVTLSEVPTYLLNAMMAIEDSQFLQHSGVSWTGILRALAKNILRGGVKEGGSTITQQLVKNYFLTPERTIKRKVTEILMALLLESRFTKDDILETYMNEIYLGQAGPFEIHGVGVASKFFFNKQAGDLTLAEAALLAGTIRGPGVYSPFTHPDRALKRREQVLKRMLDLNLIDQQEFSSAMNEPLPQRPQRLLRDQAPFFIESVKFQLTKLGFEHTEGLRVFTTLNLRAQQAATEAVTQGLLNLESSFAAIQKREEKLNAKLQAALISADPTNGFVEAVVGGRSYGETQLNRAVLSKRQVGSIFKPFVFLTAFNSISADGKPYTPLTKLLDEPYTTEYDKQSWSPQNYDEKYFGEIPTFVAIEKSLNAATSKVALQVGIKNVAETAKKMGIETPIYPVPSISLGSSTLSPYEVLQTYTTLAHQGELNPLTFIYRILNTAGDKLYEFTLKPEQVVDKVSARETVSLMENAIDYGTGRFARESGFKQPAAGKTGTTSDTKDAWFGGFTPLHAAVVWVGFDIPEPTGLTGSMAALPIWTKYMKGYATHLPSIEFSIPEGAVQMSADITRCGSEVSHPTTLVFRSGQEPTSGCWSK